MSPPNFNALGCLDQILWKGGGKTPPQCYNEKKSLVLIGLISNNIKHIWSQKLS